MFGGRPYLNGRNQESSSEAIAAYEGIAMYGSVMMKAFGNGRSATESDNENAYTGIFLVTFSLIFQTWTNLKVPSPQHVRYSTLVDY